MSCQPTLTYFDLGFRALPARLAFEIAGLPYTDNRLSFDEWGTPEGKANRNKYPTGSLPVLEAKVSCGPSFKISQSGAIAKYAAQVAGLNRADPVEGALADEVLIQLEELIYGANGVKSGLDRDAWLKGGNLKFNMERIESQITGDKFFLPGNKPSLADLWIVAFIDFFATNMVFKQAQKVDFLPFKKIMRINNNVKAIPAVAAYFKKHPAENVYTYDSITKNEVDALMAGFEVAFNKDDTAGAASAYAADCHVTVNGGVENGGPFTGTKPEEFAGFLGALRNQMGGTNAKFTVTKVEGNVHEDTWTCDAGTGTCRAMWAKDAQGAWKVVSDEITFTPKK